MFDEELWVYAKGDLKIPLSYKEGKLLQMLMKNRGKVVTHKELCEKILFRPDDKDIRDITRKAISVLINKLRIKIGNDAKIVTLLKKGYRLE